MSIDATKFVWTLSKSTVTPLEKLILLAIADRCGERGECWPSISRICKDTNLSQDAVRRHRAILIQKKLLTYTGKFAGRSNQIPIMKLMIEEWREGQYVEDQIDPPAVATPSQESVVPLAGKVGYPPAVATQNLKEEPKQESINIKTSKSSFSFTEILEANPLNLPKQMIEDWIENRKLRKCPVTATAWIRLNKQLMKCDNPHEAFEECVASGWMSFKSDWITKTKSKSKSKNSHFDNDSTAWAKDIEKDIF